MKKILIINTVGYNYDGITSVILNYLKAMDRKDLVFSFAVYNDIPVGLRQELEGLGKPLMVPHRKRYLRGYVRELAHILAENYDVIHIHGNSGTMVIETVLAKLWRVKNIILHAHSTNTDHPLVNAVMKYPMMLLADTLLACSDAAGNWLYGKRPYCVLNNAIDFSQFQFHSANRDRYRSEFGIQDEEFLVGHVGHFTAPKNHFFLIDIFAAFHEKMPDSKLLLIGNGSDFAAVQETVRQKKLSDFVIFAGQRPDAAAIYNAMDLFILPSRWEGMPLTVIEAQVNGLPLLVSDVVAPDSNWTNRVFYKALADGAHSWADKMAAIRSAHFPRDDDMTEKIREKGFDIHQKAEALRKIYLR